MTPVMSRAQMRAFDKFAIDNGIPSIVLMENAARGAADVIVQQLGEARGPIVVVCGNGNNGGDGFAVARHLHGRGFAVRAVLVAAPDKLTDDARINRDAFVALGGSYGELSRGSDLDALGLEVGAASVLVDALFGTGLARSVEGYFRQIIELMNRASARRVALDVPSGLDADTGAAFGVVLQAEHTITFGAYKLGFFSAQGSRASGRLHLVDLGVPQRVVDAVGHEAELVDTPSIAPWFVPRDPFTHKHAAGNVLAVAGSQGTIGAALLVGTGSIRAGAGLVTLASWAEAAAALESRVLELMTLRIDRADIAASLDRALTHRHAVVVGPGFGTGDDARRAVEHIVLQWEGVKVVDADALTIFAGRIDAMASAKGTIILTPHPGEAARLLGCSTRDIEENRPRAARELSRRARAIAVLKGARTVIAVPGAPLYVNTSGNPSLATAGAGDVLAGIVAAFACTLPPERAAVAGVHVHALAADVWQQRHAGADRGLLAHEIADAIPGVIAALTRRTSPLTL
jgi:NAD(P)H-hydrate epimerase